MGASVKSPDNKTGRINVHKAAIETLKRDIERDKEIIRDNQKSANAKSIIARCRQNIEDRQKQIAYHRDCIKHEKSTK